MFSIHYKSCPVRYWIKRARWERPLHQYVSTHTPWERYARRRRPRDLIFSQFSIDCCQNAFVSGAYSAPKHTDLPLHPLACVVSSDTSTVMSSFLPRTTCCWSPLPGTPATSPAACIGMMHTHDWSWWVGATHTRKGACSWTVRVQNWNTLRPCKEAHGTAQQSGDTKWPAIVPFDRQVNDTQPTPKLVSWLAFFHTLRVVLDVIVSDHMKKTWFIISV